VEYFFWPFSIFGTNAILPSKDSENKKVSEAIITNGKKKGRKKADSRQAQLAVITLQYSSGYS